MANISTYGYTYEVKDKYAEGHVLNAQEAAALNGLRAENISHQVRPMLVNDFDMGKGSVIESGSDAEKALLDMVKKLEETYEFGQRSGGGRTMDPLQKKIKELARSVLDSKISADPNYTKVGKVDGSDAEEPGIYPRERYNAKLAELCKHDSIIKAAKEALKAEQKISGVEIAA